MKRISTFLIGGLLALAATGAQAQQQKPIEFEGFVRIAVEGLGKAPSAGQCLIRGNNGNGEFVRHMWSELGGPARWCGFRSEAEYLQNGQAVFEVTYHSAPGASIHQYTIRNVLGKCLIANPNGTTGVGDCMQGTQTGRGLWLIEPEWAVGDKTLYASIRSKVDNRCLIFSNNGRDTRPTLYRWNNDPSDSLYCGLGVDGLIESGQGFFAMTSIARWPW